MFDVQSVFDDLDDNKIFVFPLCTIAMISNYVWFVSAYRVGRKHRTYTLPLFCTFFWFAHDTSYVARFDTWWGEYDHWFPQLFWVLITVTVAFEIAFILQDVQYAQRDVAPQVPRALFVAGMLGAVGATVVMWTWLKDGMDDPIYLNIFALTIASYPPFATVMLLKRGNRRGMTMTMCWGYMGMTVCYFTASTFFFGPEFHDWKYVMLGIVTVTWGSVLTYLVWRAPEYDPQRDPDATPDQTRTADRAVLA